jgi:two-component system, NtrC family, response regulator HydG
MNYMTLGEGVLTQGRASDPVIRIVAIDDDSEFLDFLSHAFAAKGVEIVTALDPQDGLHLALSERTDIVLLDLVMPGCHGFEVLEKIVAANPTINVVLLTAQYSTEMAVEAIQKGAADYLNKPISLELLLRRVGKFVKSAQERHKARHLSNELVSVFQFEGIVGWSPLMLEVFDRIRRVAPHFQNILIGGDTGTGKELVARSLHRLSPFASGPFVVCNCAAVVETLFESELFGHEKGAFTGATQDKKGYFELAHKGTLFLDEIGDASLGTQAKLLRVLQDHAVQRIGSPAVHLVDVRVITATNRNLQAMVADRTFRDDLYYRISAVEINLPRLSQRREDIPLLERHFMERFAKQYNKHLQGITRKAQIVLSRYSWPGNVRELENVFAHSCMLAQGDVIDVPDLPERLQTEPNQAGDGDVELCSLEKLQMRHIKRVLKHVNDNRSQAADILGIGRATLYRILAEEDAKRHVNQSKAASSG